MDATKILKRAWKILWNYQALWVIGIILAMTTAATLPRNGNNYGDGSGPRPEVNYTFPSGTSVREAIEQLRQEFNHANPWDNLSTGEWTTFLWIMGGVLLLLLVVGVVMTIARYVAETAAIRMVDEYERTGQKANVRQGLRYGWSRTAWRLFLIDILVSLPIFLLILLGLLLGVGIYFLVTAENAFLTTAGIIASIGLFFLLIFLGVILGLALNLLREFFSRACALEQVGVIQAIRLGWGMVKRGWKNAGLMWLIMIAVRIGWSIALVIALVLSLPLLVMTGLAGLIVGGLPALLVGGVTSLFASGALPWILAALAGLPFFLLIALSPTWFLRGLGLVYNSAVWTLTYRELNTLQSLAGQDLLNKNQPDEAIPSPLGSGE
jgi:hypothetical protein